MMSTHTTADEPASPPEADSPNANTGAAFGPIVPSVTAGDVPADISAPDADAPDSPKPEEAKRIRYRAKPKHAFPLHLKAVAVDLDGTLLDTAADIATAANAMRRAFGFAPLDPAVIRQYIGKGIGHLVGQVMKDAVGELGASARKVAVAQFERQYAACFAETSRPYPNAVAGLEAMRDKGLELACVTNKNAAFTLPLLEKTGLAGYFSLVVSGDTVSAKKPSPEPLAHAAERLNVAPTELLLIGDSANDAEAAREAGCPVFIVPYGYNGGQELRGLDCDAFIDDLTQVLKYVKMVS